VALAIQVIIGLGAYGDACRKFLDREYCDTFLIIIKFFELWEFVCCASAGLIIGLIALSLMSRRHVEPTASPQNPSRDPSQELSSQERRMHDES